MNLLVPVVGRNSVAFPDLPEWFPLGNGKSEAGGARERAGSEDTGSERTLGQEEVGMADDNDGQSMDSSKDGLREY